MSDATNQNNLNASWHWDPVKFLAPSQRENPMSYYLIVLNSPIKQIDIFIQLAMHAEEIIAADGGANRVRDLLLSLGFDEDDDCNPSVICGDLDSVRSDVLEYYSSQDDVTIDRDPDQYKTDFTKALRWVPGFTSRNGDEGPIIRGQDIIVFGGLEGRADQAFSQIHHLFSAADNSNDGNIYLFTAENILFRLRPGVNKINTPVAPKQLGENVGIIPIGKKAIISTQGLEWDVTDWPIEFGVQMSTSNHIKSDSVSVTSTEPVLFTVEIAQDLANGPLAERLRLRSGDPTQDSRRLEATRSEITSLKEDTFRLHQRVDHALATVHDMADNLNLHADEQDTILGD